MAYPTESVFGLGCDPDSEIAVQSLLEMKQRPLHKGFILVAANYQQVAKYVNTNELNNKQLKIIATNWSIPITWVVPAHKKTPKWLTGRFSSIAIRISFFNPIKYLCLAFDKPIISTSANLFGKPAARTVLEVHKQFNVNMPPILNEFLGGYNNPSEIRNIINGKLIRKG